MRLASALFFILLVQALPSFGQDSGLRFDHLTTSDGLPENMVVCIFRDSRGFMWLGTENKGLCRYDGNYVKVYSHDSLNKNSIPGNFITNIMEDGEGKLWVSCFDKGVTHFDPVLEQFVNYTHDSLQPKSFSEGYANGGVVDSKGRVWIATWGGGINLYDPATDGFIHFRHDKNNSNSVSSNRTKDVKQDKNGYLWLSTWTDDGGNHGCVQKLNPDTRQFECVETTNVVDPQGKPVNNAQGLNLIHKVMVDSRQNIWFATYLGVYRYDQNSKTFYQFISKRDDPNAISFNNIRSLCEDDNGDIWMGSLGGGLNKYDRKTGNITIYRYDYNNAGSVSDNAIRGIYKDLDGRLWIGTFTGGVNILDPRKQEFRLISNRTLKATFFNRSGGNEIQSFCIAPDSTLLVSSGSGLSVYDYRANELKNVLPFPKNHSGDFICAGMLQPLADGSVFAAAGRSLFFYYPGKQQFSNVIEYSPPPHFYYPGQVRLRPDGKIWLFNEGFAPDIFDPVTRTSEPWAPGGKEVLRASDLLELEDHQFLVSTFDKGLFLLDKAGTRSRNFRNDSTTGCLPSDQVFFVTRGRDKKIWVGTGAGLRIFDITSGKFIIPDNCRALATEPVFSCIDDAEGATWFIAQHGIWRFAASSSAFQDFGRALGLYAREFLSIPARCSPDGYIFAACTDGVVWFDPQRLKSTPAPPRIFLSGIRLFGNYYKGDSANFAQRHLLLPYNQNSISFEFSANDFTSPHEVSYYYMLEGYDTGWVNSGARTLAAYTNLPAGDYFFKVRCRTIFQKDSENTATVHIVITPPFWKTWWFYTLSVITVCSLVVAFVRYRLNSLRKEKEKLERIVGERTAEVVAQKEIIEQKNKEVTDSIHYAKTIQEAVLPTADAFRGIFPQSFILFKPKDIVSGDFYWVSRQGDELFLATVDCTGHGVPGGFMSMLGAGMLNDIVDQLGITSPAQVLEQMRERIIIALKQSEETSRNKDGMDLCLYKIDLKKMLLTYSGANNGLYIIRNGKLEEYPGTKQPIGYYMGERKDFVQTEVQLQKGDLVYSYTDGYADQFGGDKGKKFKWSNLEKLLERICGFPMEEQCSKLDETIERWKGSHEQIDDILVMGVKI